MSPSLSRSIPLSRASQSEEETKEDHTALLLPKILTYTGKVKRIDKKKKKDQREMPILWGRTILLNFTMTMTRAMFFFFSFFFMVKTRSTALAFLRIEEGFFVVFCFRDER